MKMTEYSARYRYHLSRWQSGMFSNKLLWADGVFCKEEGCRSWMLCYSEAIASISR